MEVCDGVSDLKAYIASIGEVLLRNIVRKLALVEVDFAVVSVPLDEVTKGVLREKTEGLDVVRIDLKAILCVVSAAIDGPTNVVVSSPEPGVVNDDVLVVDLEHALGADF